LKAVLIDSDVLIEVARGRERTILARWEELGRSDAAILCSPVTIAELWHGVRPPEQKALEALFHSLTTLAIDAEVGRRAGEYLRQFSKSHRLELGDALIAATAAIHKVELWTRNRRHYPEKDVEFY
jgi:hypothetical protein